MWKSTVEAKQWLDKRYEESAPEESTIIDWYAEFKRGRTKSDNAERSGHPKSAAIPENITKVHKIVLVNQKLKLREIASTLNISEDSVFTILHKYLGMRKLFSKWVPCLLIPEQKQQCVENSERWVNSSWWKPSKATKNSTVGWQGYGIRILGRAWYFVYRLSWER